MIEYNFTTIFLNPVSSNEIENYIKNFKDKAGGVDCIHSKTLKYLSSIICQPLKYIFNLSLLARNVSETFPKSSQTFQKRKRSMSALKRFRNVSQKFFALLNIIRKEMKELHPRL